MEPRTAVEHFHLTFCRLLCAGADRGDFAIKGGCNLRFFFGSARYSEDLDLDVQRIPQRTLRGRVDKILGGVALLQSLRGVGIEVTEVSAPKQTDTTQLWKAALKLRDRALASHTKVEFSRRDDVHGAKVDPIERGFAAEHRQQPLLLPHYPADVAVQQKVRALVGRSQVQARDLFDLSLLFARVKDSGEALAPVKPLLGDAITRALELSYDDYSGQVVAWLAPLAAESLGTRAAWDAMQLQVVEMLERVAGAP